MPALSEYPNVFGTALAVLKEKGYQVWWDEVQQLHCCERNGWDFFAENPIGLLGLVAIFEARQPSEYREYWWRQADTDRAAYDSLQTRSAPYQSVIDRRPGRST